jgi:AraC family transcriptional regulator
VGTPRIQMISQGRRVPVFHDADVSSSDRQWAGFLLEESKSKMEPVTNAWFPKSTLVLCTKMHGEARWKHRGVWHNYRIGPGSLFMARSGAEMQAAETTDSWSRIVVQLDTDTLHKVASEHVDAIENSLVTALTTVDDRLTATILAMREEISEGCPSGRLFGESISLALLAYLSAKYATPGNLKRPTSLSPAQRRAIFDYIRSNLSHDISVCELARIVQMSPAHFSRVFRASFGIAPYRYVIVQRVQEAKRMLVSPMLSSSQVGSALGFASQSHFIKVFRQATGVTPKQFRAGF